MAYNLNRFHLDDHDLVRFDGPRAGEPAVDFTLCDTDGQTVSLSDYKGKDTPILIVCPKHGQFTQRPASHWKGAGCPKCRNQVTNTADFIEKASKVHNGKYGYEFVDYVNSEAKIVIRCPRHGKFEQRPDSHLQGTGCFKCASEERRKNAPRKSTQVFISEAIQAHGDRYDYSLVEYKSAHKKVKII